MKFSIVFLALMLFSVTTFAQYWDINGTALENNTAGAVNIGSNNGSGGANVQIGNNRDANGNSYFDLVSDVSSFPDFGARLIRYGKGSLSGVTRFEHRGQGPMEFKSSENGEVKFTRQSNVLSMIIKSDGKVGIGTESPGSFQLAVDGNIGSREVQVTATSPFPDYVFSNEYKLMPLKEVEHFIRVHNHLPKVPSASDVAEKGGFELGSLSMTLLEKIEELTLYIIEQEKRIKSLENLSNQK